jgi:hypothetical protein
VDSINFPVLFSGTYSYLATVANGGLVTNASGFDIIFTSDSGGSNLLNWEIETYAQTTGVVNFWIRVPTLSTSVDTVIYMFYGNSAISTFQGGAVGSAWSSIFKGVWHYPNGASLTALDSTSNARNGTITGATATAGNIDGGANFAGGASTNNIVVPQNVVINNTVPFTASVWFNLVASDGTARRIWDKADQTAPARHSILFISNNTIHFQANAWSVQVGEWSVPIPSTGAFHYLTVTYLYAATTDLPIIYVDGVPQILTPVTAPLGVVSAENSNLYIGNRNLTDRSFNGVLDEFHWINAITSQDWITAEYNNQSAPGDFYSISGQTFATVGKNNIGLNNLADLNNLSLRTIL